MTRNIMPVGLPVGRLMGTPVYANRLLTVPVNVPLRRSWKERLFTRPWRPWQVTKIVTQYHPDPNVYSVPDMRAAIAGGFSLEALSQNVLIGHPDTIKALLAAAEKPEVPHG